MTRSLSFEGSNFTRCLGSVEVKKFPGDREACQDFEETEIFEIDDDGPLAQRIRELREKGELHLEEFNLTLVEEEIQEDRLEDDPRGWLPGGPEERGVGCAG